MYVWVNVNLFLYLVSVVLYPNTQKLATKQPSPVPYICFHIHVVNSKCNKKIYGMAYGVRRI